MQIVSKTRNKFSDTLVMTGRSMRHSIRNLDTLIVTAVLPIIIMLLFVYVFGGAINTGSVDYINYVIPGIILLCIGYCASLTAISVNDDITRGVIDRFRSMPIAKSSVLTGHVLTSVVRNVFSTVLLVLVGLLLGFRTSASVTDWLLIIGIMLLYTLAMTWLSVVFGLLANSAESAGVFGFVALFLPYLSSAFVPTETMPGFLRAFVEHQPITPITETIRSLMMSGSLGDKAWIALAWCLGILIVSIIVSLSVYKSRTSK